MLRRREQKENGGKAESVPSESVGEIHHLLLWRQRRYSLILRLLIFDTRIYTSVTRSPSLWAPVTAAAAKKEEELRREGMGVGERGGEAQRTGVFVGNGRLRNKQDERTDI